MKREQEYTKHVPPATASIVKPDIQGGGGTRLYGRWLALARVASLWIKTDVPGGQAVLHRKEQA